MSKRCHSQSKLKLYKNVLNFINHHLCNSPHPRKIAKKDNTWRQSVIPKRTK